MVVTPSGMVTAASPEMAKLLAGTAVAPFSKTAEARLEQPSKVGA